MRPRRIYTHTFTHPSPIRHTIARSGETPCQAKNAAFAALEQDITARQWPRTGWRLLEQQDVTHLIARG